MFIVLPDNKIIDLIHEKKKLPIDISSRTTEVRNFNYSEQFFNITGEEGNKFKIVLKKSIDNPLDFSIILVYFVPNSSRNFRLRRYNGRSHWHTNRIERNCFFDFHIHTATLRYQELGAKEESYAEPTQRFCDISSGLQCLISDCGFYYPYDQQLDLFQEPIP